VIINLFRASRASGPPRYIGAAAGARPWPTEVAPGDAAARVRVIPLLHQGATSDDVVLDATLGIYSARMANNASTMGLYDRYAVLTAGGADRARSLCRFLLQLIHVMPDSLR
jgi:hypothetical protein